MGPKNFLSRFRLLSEVGGIFKNNRTCLYMHILFHKTGDLEWKIGDISEFSN